MSDLIADQTRLFQAHGQKVRIQFFKDLEPAEPWDDDGAVPLVAYDGDRRSSFYTEPARGYELLHPWQLFTDRQIKRHLARIVELCPAESWGGRPVYDDPRSFDRFIREEYPHLSLREARREWLDSYFGDGETGRGRLETIAEFWRLLGVPVMVKETRGYSQGDWRLLMIVAHPDAVKAWGFRNMAAYLKACPNDLKAAFSDYGAWLWGDVIGYRAQPIDPEEFAADDLDPATVTAGDLNALHYCGDVETCWGFFPDDRDAWPFAKMYADAIGAAVGAAYRIAEVAAERAAEKFAGEMTEARPDLTPQWEGVRA